MTPWNKGLKGGIPWNKGLTCKLPPSKLKGRSQPTEFKERISLTLKEKRDKFIPHYVYYLIDPLTKIVRYVGFSENFNKRFQTHLARVNDASHKCRWIASLLKKDLKPILSIRCIVASKLEACRIETLLIAKLRAQGVDLTNLTPGGEGGNTSQGCVSKLIGRRWTQERREAHKGRQAWNKGLKATDQHRNNLSHSKKNKPWTEKQREAITKGLTAPGVREGISAKIKGVPKSVQGRANIGDGQRRRRAKEKTWLIAYTADTSLNYAEWLKVYESTYKHDHA